MASDQLLASTAAPASAPSPAGPSALHELAEIYASLTPVATRMQPNAALHDSLVSRGAKQFVYGEITLVDGCPTLMREILLDGTPPCECVLLDIGSGVGQLCLYAAAVTGVRMAIGMELVPSRHAVAEAAHRALHEAGHDVQSSTRFLAADFLDEAHIPQFAESTHAFLANAVFEETLTARLVRHVAMHAPKLQVLALLKEPTAETLASAGLRLVRTAAVSVSWLSHFGWPLYLYRRVPTAAGQQHGQHEHGQQRAAGVEPSVSEDFEAAKENSDWFSMC